MQTDRDLKSELDALDSFGAVDDSALEGIPFATPAPKAAVPDFSESMRRTIDEDVEAFSSDAKRETDQSVFDNTREAIKLDAQEAEKKEAEDNYGVFGQSFGVLKPEERQKAADEEQVFARDFKARMDAAGEFYRTPSESWIDAILKHNPVGVFQGALTKGLEASATKRANLADAVAEGRAALPKVTGLRAGVENTIKGAADAFVVSTIKAVGMARGYGTQAAGGTYLEQADKIKVDPSDDPLYKLGQNVETFVEKHFPGDPARQMQFTQQLAQGVGSTIGFAGSGWLAKVAKLGEKGTMAVIGLVGAAAQSSQAFEEATEALKSGKGTEVDRIVNVLAALPLGASEALPFAPTIGPHLKGLGKRMAAGAEQAMEESLQEAGQTLGSNIVKKYTYAPEQTVMEGVPEGAAIGLLTGGAFGGALGAKANIAAQAGDGDQDAPKVQEARARTSPPIPTITPDARPIAAMTDGEDPGARPRVQESKSSAFSEPELQAAEQAIRAFTGGGPSDAAQALPETAKPAPRPVQPQETAEAAKPQSPETADENELDFPAIAADIGDYLDELGVETEPSHDDVVAVARAVAKGEDFSEVVDKVFAVQDEQTDDKAPDQEARARFADVLASKTLRSKWAESAGIDAATLETLTQEALADGRLEMRFGKPVRTKAARTAATRKPQEKAPPRERPDQAPLLRSEEKRLEGLKSDAAYGAASSLFAARGDVDAFRAALDSIRSNRKIKKADLADTLKAFTGSRTKPKTRADAISRLEQAHTAWTAKQARKDKSRAQPSDSRPMGEGPGSLSEGRLPGTVRPDGGVGGTGDASGGNGGRSGRPSTDVAGGRGNKPTVAGDVRGEGGGDRSDPGTGAGDGERGTDTQAAAGDRRGPVEARQPSPEEIAALEADAKAEREELEHARADRLRRNYQITDADKIGAGGPKAKIRGNLAAIELLKQIEDEGRSATDEEKQILVKYVGWGAFAQDMFDDYKTQWKTERLQLQNLLTPEEYRSAKGSVLNAHYTSPDVIKGMWGALAHLGFKGGRVLEPAAGVGHFIGLQPESLRAESAWTAVELDSVSGRLTKLLYGASDVRVGGFEEQIWPDDHFDLAISNVPFDKTGPHDPAYKAKYSLHDYFFIKALDKVRPGGIVAFITSRYTLDRTRDAARRDMEKRATFIGAIRLPGGNKGAFKANAGTDVTTDIIFFRKRISGETDGNSEWTGLESVKTPDGPTLINAYFAAHPEMMLGKMRLIGSQYRAGEPVLIGPTDALDAKILDAAEKLPADQMTARGEEAAFLETLHETVASEDIDVRVKEGAFFAKDGEIFRKIFGMGHGLKLGKQDAARIRSFIGLRDAVNAILSAQAKGDGVDMDALRTTLNKAYDAFVKKFGPVNLTHIKHVTRKKDGRVITMRRTPNLSAIEDDPDAAKTAAIELYDEKTGKATKAAIFREDIIAPYVRPLVTGPSDALAVSLNETGGVDMALMAGMLGMSEKRVAATLGDAVYRNPKGEKWETSAHYLSGDVLKKLEQAKAAADLDPSYRRNVMALEMVQPPPLTRTEITIPLGASWVPVDVIGDFLSAQGMRGMQVELNTGTKAWRVTSAGRMDAATVAQWGTNDLGPAEIVEHALNSKPVVITHKDREGRTYRDHEGEELARGKVRTLRDAFVGEVIPGAPAAIGGWVWEEEARALRLEGLYNQHANRYVKEEHDGSHLIFPGLARAISFPDGSTGTINLTPARVNTVARVIQNGNTLIDHAVGGGKTWTSIMAVMEMKRLGMVRRPMFVVPNHMLRQFSAEFLQAYPNAKLLVATKDQMSKARRKEFAAKAASEKWDGIIITHSAFGRLRMADSAYREFLAEQLDRLEAAKNDASGDATVKDIERAKNRLRKKLNALTSKDNKDEGVLFEELGVDHLTVDEAHFFKNLFFATRHTRIKGISNASESQRATDLFIKIRHLEKARPGRSTLFLTGTPLSNTMAEVYTMMRYLQNDLLDELGLAEFDSWAQTYGIIETKTELAPNGRDLRDESSFSRFVNVAELSTLFGKIADTQTAESLKLKRPDLKGGKATVVESDLTDVEENFIQALIKDMEALKGVKPEPGKANFLSLFTKGLQAATDLRLVDPTAPFNPTGKIGQAIGNIKRIWEAGNKDPKAPNKAQLVFLDMGVPGGRPSAPKTQSRDADAGQSAIDVVRSHLSEDEDGEAIEQESISESDAEAAELLRGKFNLYEDIKQRLVADGIPADQIAFIHDAKNDDQKQKLFDKVNAGQIRVLIGTRMKMGVGTNIQKRLYAVHHIDPPWRPADLEQADARILRQGNLNKEIEIYRYISKRSFDSYRWQILEKKSNYIAQFRAGARGLRVAEDIDSPLPDAAEIKAAATGDPRIMELAETDREVRILTAQAAGHAATSSRARSMIARLSTERRMTQDHLATLEKDASLVVDLKGDAFAATVYGRGGEKKVFTKRKDVGDAFKRYLTTLADGAYYGREIDIEFGELSGFKMVGTLKKTPSGIEVLPQISGSETYSAEWPFAFNEETKPVAIIQRYEALVAGLPDRLRNKQRLISEIDAQMPGLEAKSTPSPFPKQGALVAAQKKLAALVAVLKGKGKAPTVSPTLKIGEPLLVKDLPEATWKDIKRQIKLTQPIKTIDDLMTLAGSAHEMLTELGNLIAEKVGVIFRAAPPKTRKLIVEKLNGDDPRRITDAARGGFEVQTPLEADQVVEAIAQALRVADEGWFVTDGGYFDRKVMVVFDNDLVGEVQIWPPGMFEAKEFKGGHKYYEEWRDPKTSEADKKRLEAQMRGLYGAVIEQMVAEFQALAKPASAAAMSNSGNLASSSSRETEGQSRSGARMIGADAPLSTLPVTPRNTAASPLTTAGASSQMKYPSLSGASVISSPSDENIENSSGSVNTAAQAAEFAAAVAALKAKYTEEPKKSPLIKSDFEDAVVLGDGVMASISGYHGSGVRFTRFDWAKMRDGGGSTTAQTAGMHFYAFGHHFASDRANAADYHNLVASTLYDGASYDINNPAHLAARALETAKGSRETATRELQDRAAYHDARARNEGLYVRLTGSLDQTYARNYRSAIRALASGTEAKTARAGAVYDVTLDVESDDLLDLDRRVSEMAPHVRQAAQKVATAALPKLRQINDASARALIQRIDSGAGELWGGEIIRLAGGRSEAGSATLLAAGIPGVTYRDEYSRMAVGTPNFVIFDDTLIQIDRVDGVAVTDADRANALATLSGTQMSLASAVAQPYTEPALPADSAAQARVLALPGTRQREHARRLFEAGLEQSQFQRAIDRLLSDKRLSGADVAAVAESYAGFVDGQDRRSASQAIKRAFAERVHDLTMASLSGFDPALSGSNLVWNDDAIVVRLEDLANRLPPEIGLAVRDVLRATIGTRQVALDGFVASAEQALRMFEINPGSAKKILAVSLAYGPDTALQTFTHEEIHALRALGLLDDAWNILSGVAARKPKKKEALRLIDVMLKQERLKSPKKAKDLKARAGKITYREIYDIDTRYAHLNEEQKIEEVVANAAADWADGHDYGTRFERAMLKIRDFIESLANFLHGQGFETVDSIFRSIWSGAVAKQLEDNKVKVNDGRQMFSISGGQDGKRDVDALGYYSRALRAARSLPQERGTPEQMLEMLKKAGARKAEIEATGLDKFFEENGRPRAGDLPPIGAQQETMSARPLEHSNAIIATPSSRSVPAYSDAVKQTMESRGWKLLGGINQSGLSSSQYLTFTKADGSLLKLSKTGRGKWLREFKGGAGPSDGYFRVRVSDHGNFSGRNTPQAEIRIDRGDALDNLAARADRLLQIEKEHHSGSNSGTGDAGSGAVTETPSSGDRTSGQSGSGGRLKQPSITKAEIIKHLEENRVEVREVVRARDHDDPTEFELSTIEQTSDGWEYGSTGDTYATREEAEAAARTLARGVADGLRSQGRYQDETKWSAHSLDPNSETYGETVLHLPENKSDTITGLSGDALTNALAQRRFGRDWASLSEREQNVAMNSNVDDHETQNFRSGHFDEPNIIGHYQHSIVKIKGEEAFLAHQIQSDFAERIRDDSRNALAHNLFGKPFKDLDDTGRKAVSREMSEMAKRGEKPAGARDEAKIKELKKARDEAARKAEAIRAANDLDVIAKEISEFVQIHAPVAVDRAYFGTFRGDKINSYEAIDLTKLITTKYTDKPRVINSDGSITLDSIPYARHPNPEVVSAVTEMKERMLQAREAVEKAERDVSLKTAELRTAEASVPGHPLVNTTDQWVNTTLRHLIRKATDSDAKYIAIPHGDTVLSYNPGDSHGMRVFYGDRTQEGIVPKNLRKLLSAIDKDGTVPFRVTKVATSNGTGGYRTDTSNPFDRDQTGFTVFPITDKVRDAVLDDGQPMFAISGRQDGGQQDENAILDSAISNLKKALGINVTQNLFGVTIHVGKRRIKFNPRSNIRGQTSRSTGHVGVRRSRDLQAIAHEGGHSLELTLTSDLDAIKAQYAAELVAPFAPNTPMPKLTASGFSGLALDNVELAALERAVTGADELARWSTLVGNAKSTKNPVYDEAGYQRVIKEAAMARAALIRLTGEHRADGLVDDVRKAKPDDLAGYIRERFVPMGATPRRRTAPVPDGDALSEGFARWFEKYVMDRSGAEIMAPNFFAAFEDLLEAVIPSTLDGLHAVQTEYRKWTMRLSPEAMASDLVSVESDNSWAAIDENSKAFVEKSAGWAATAYRGMLDDLSAMNQIVRRLLAVADRNGVRDAEGRPISLKVAANPYKIARMFRGSHATGYSWLKDGVALNGKGIVSPGLTTALETLFDGAAWDAQTYQVFGQYLISKRAIAEYERLDDKKSRLANIATILDQGATAWSTLQISQAKDLAKADRMAAARRRQETILADRNRSLRTARTAERHAQERLGDLRADLEEAMRAVEDGSDVARTTRDRKRRSLQLAERTARDARAAVVDLAQEIEMIETGLAVDGARDEVLREAIARRQDEMERLSGAVDLMTKEQKRVEKLGASRPPTLEPKDWHLDLISKVEARDKYKRFAPAAEMVYAFTHALLRKRLEAGLISKDQFDLLAARKDWYVPFLRDMSDAADTAVFTGRGGRAWSPFKKFDGSDRAIINPMESLSQQAYSLAQHISVNEVSGALAALARMAGPGSANIAEIMEREETLDGAEPETWERIRDIAISMGIDEADAMLIAQQMEVNFADAELQLLWAPAKKGPMPEPTLPLWENGVRKHVVLRDRDFGRDAVDGIMGLGKEQMNWFLELLGYPARWLQIGITTHPTFMPRNLIRDVFDAWIKTGSLPIVTQIVGARHFLGDTHVYRDYVRAGGIVGGRNIAALTMHEQQEHVMDLDPKHVRLQSVLLGGVAGGIIGSIAFGPLGGYLGTILGGYGTRRGHILKAIESVETMTRVGVAAHAYKRAVAHNPYLSHEEAVLEGAYVARDVFDWNRRGSKALAVVRMITFLNAQLQSMDKAARSLGGAGDRGSAVARHLRIVFRREHAVPLSADEQRDLGDAYKTWARWGLYTAMLLGLYALSRSGDDDDDIKQDDIADRTKSTHSWFPGLLPGVDLRVPKAFEWAVPANFIEILFDAMEKRDPRVGERMATTVQHVLAPPAVPQALNLAVGPATNRDIQSLVPWLFGEDGDRVNREIVPQHLKRLSPEQQFDAFTHELSKDVSHLMVKANVPEHLIPSPKMLDFVFRTGGYWGKDIQRAYAVHKYNFTGQEPAQMRPPEWPVVGGFTGVAARQSKSVDELYRLMARSGGELTEAAATYTDLISKKGKPAEAESFLMRLNPEERAYAILKFNFSAADARRHPLERLIKVAGVNSGIKKDIILDRLAPEERVHRKKTYDWDKKITPSGAMKTQINDVIERLTQAEAWNTMVAMNRPGWQGRKEIAVAPLLEEFKAVSSDVYELWRDRVESAKIEDFEPVKRDWPKMRDELLRHGADASF